MGNLTQLFGVTEARYAAGRASGMRFWDVTTAGGLRLRFHPDRCLDIDEVYFKGVPFAWRSSVGPSQPLPGDTAAGRQGFLQQFGGGFLTTCGLRHFGPPLQRGEELLPTHGRVHSLPAESSSWRLTGFDDEPAFVIDGVVREARSGAEHLSLTRQLRVPVNGAVIQLSDRVENHGFRDEPLALLHHLNLGFPLLGEGTVVTVNGETSDILEFSGTRSCVTDGGVVSVSNPFLDMHCAIRFDHAALHLWRQPDPGMNVLGVEPANHAWMQQTGSDPVVLPRLAPGETKTFNLSVTFSQGCM